jgi:hypothetical protein
VAAQASNPSTRPIKFFGLVFAVLIGLGVVQAIGRSGSPSGGSAGGGVQWDDYAPGMQSRIDGLATDCDALQQEFDNADANNAATMSRTGHNNAELMKYIDAKLRTAGCY